MKTYALNYQEVTAEPHTKMQYLYGTPDDVDAVLIPVEGYNVVRPDGCMMFEEKEEFEERWHPVVDCNSSKLPFNPIQQKNGLERSLSLFRVAQTSQDYEALTKDEKKLFCRQIEIMEELWEIVRNRAILQKESQADPDPAPNSDRPVTFDFSSAVQWLKAQQCIRRTSWPEGTFVVKQVPADISSEIIPKMTSLPDSTKKLLLSRSSDATIHYRNQMLQIDRNGIANSWLPTAEDVFADDWQIVVE